MLSQINLYQMRTIFPAIDFSYFSRPNIDPAIFSDWVFKKKTSGNLLLTSRFMIGSKPLAQIELRPHIYYFSAGEIVNYARERYLRNLPGIGYDYYGWMEANEKEPFSSIYHNAFVGLRLDNKILPENIRHDKLQQVIFDIFAELRRISSYIHDNPESFIWSIRNSLLEYRTKFDSPLYNSIMFFICSNYEDNMRCSNIYVYIAGNQVNIDEIIEYYDYAITFIDWNIEFLKLSSRERVKRREIKEVLKSLEPPVEDPYPRFQISAESSAPDKMKVLLVDLNGNPRFEMREMPTASVHADIIVEQPELPEWHLKFS